jgi:hypothetical protein
MALDPHLRLRDAPAERILDAVAEAHSSGHGVTEGVHIVSRHCNTDEIGQADFEVSDNRYDLLESKGYIAIADSTSMASAGEVQLSGGSICSVFLLLGERRVRKLVRPSSLDAIDTVNRHRGEAIWLAQLHRNGIGIFPPIHTATDRGDQFEIQLEFVPRYTLGERVLQSRLSNDTLWMLVSNALEDLTRDIYHLGPLRSQQSYLEVVERRFSHLRSARPFYNDLWVTESQIDGLACPSVGEVLRMLRTDERFSSIVQPEPGRSCHGDLVLDDMLPSSPYENSLRTIFVDPNPQNSSVLVDFGKLAMNGLIGYDVGCRDGIRMSVYNAGKTIVANSEIDDKWAKAYTCLRRFGDRLAENWETLPGAKLAAAVGLDSRSLRAQAGLQSLALPAFHDLHHGAGSRGRYFALAGLKTVVEALVG